MPESGKNHCPVIVHSLLTQLLVCHQSSLIVVGISLDFVRLLPAAAEGSSSNPNRVFRTWLKKVASYSYQDMWHMRHSLCVDTFISRSYFRSYHFRMNEQH